ncbi:MAG TPA: hypothetical protein PLO67_13260 [Saprospiraceae bacterium]|nr:hypothetical protein [Saprospiraceae bacterium]HPI07615.1 hypothetical protein [Saprospiraceae bacterium]
MNPEKKLGIWMDHASAHIIAFTSEPVDSTTVDSQFTHQEKEQSLSKSEHLMHNKEQHQQAEFYKKLGEIIKNYDEVLLFGPTDAKSELYNILREDHLFENIKIDMLQTEKMTEKQEQIFVKKHFSQH